MGRAPPLELRAGLESHLLTCWLTLQWPFVERMEGSAWRCASECVLVCQRPTLRRRRVTASPPLATQT